MRNYTSDTGQDRVIFSATEAAQVKEHLSAVNNTHAAFQGIKARFEEAGSINISKKQYDVLNRSLFNSGPGGVEDIVGPAVNRRMASSRLGKEMALRQVMSHLEASYGDWTHRDELADIPDRFHTLEVSTSTGRLFLGFQNLNDLDTAEIALEPAFFM